MILVAGKPNPELDQLLSRVRNAPPMTSSELRLQRISFAFGNASFENDNITREMVEAEHDRIFGI